MSPLTPYYPAKPGDPLLSDTWNNLQLRIQQELAQHDHQEGRGALLDGSAIASSAELKVNKLEAAVSLTVRGLDVHTRLNELAQQQQQLVSRTGGVISGTLSMTSLVGIGTTTPGSLLTVVHAGSDKATVEIQGRGNHSWGIGLTVRTTGEGTNGASILLRTRTKSWQMRGETVAGDSPGFQIAEDGGDAGNGSGSGTPRFHISAGGKVGIGTTTPNKLLTLVPPLSHHAPMEIRGRGDHAWGIGLVVRATAEGNNGASVLLRTRDKSWQVRGESGANKDPGFQITEGGGDESYGSGSGTPRLHISAGGKVGIGTTTPESLLTVLHRADDHRATVEIQGRGNHSHGVGLMLSSTGEGNNGVSIVLRTRTKNWQVRGETVAGNSPGFQISEDGGDSVKGSGFGTPRLHISAGGKVGIGTVQPTELLQVNGNLRIADGDLRIDLPSGPNKLPHPCILKMQPAGFLEITNAYGTKVVLGPVGWALASDAALKTNVQAMEGILERVLALRPVRFEWKRTHTRSLGLVAQEVEALFPELVTEHDSGASGPPVKGVSYDVVGVLAIAALQELKRQYDARLTALEARLP